MLAEFSIWPLDAPHVSQDVAHATEILDQLDVRYEVGPMGTAVEGEWNDVLQAIQACHQAARTAHQRVVTTITIDDDARGGQTIGDAKAKVEAQRQSAS